MKIFQKLKNVKWANLLFAVFLTGLGLLFLSVRKSLDYLALGIGICLTAFAIFYAVSVMASKTSFFKMLYATLAFIAGVVTIFAKENAIGVIVTAAGLLLIIDGAFKLHTAVSAKSVSTPGWWLMVVFASLTVLGAFVTVKWDTDLGDALAVVLAFSLFADAVGNLLSVFYLPISQGRMKKNLQKELQNETEGNKNDETTVTKN